MIRLLLLLRLAGVALRSMIRTQRGGFVDIFFLDLDLSFFMSVACK